jgi:hypothetical protein
LQVNRKGAAYLLGKAPDGRVFTAGTKTSATGVVIVNAWMNAHRAALAGALQFAPSAESDLDGLLQWTTQTRVRTGRTISTVVAGAPLTAQGSRFIVLKADQEPLSGTNTVVGGTFTLIEPDGQTLTSPLLLRGRTAFPGTSGIQSLILADTAYGVFRGRIKDATGRVISFDGVFQPKAQIGSGRFSVGSAYGSIEIAP